MIFLDYYDTITFQKNETSKNMLNHYAAEQGHKNATRNINVSPLHGKCYMLQGMLQGK